MKVVRPCARIKVKIAPIRPIKTPGIMPKPNCLANRRPIAKPPAAQAISMSSLMVLKPWLVLLNGYPKSD
jgi:hypothetical protein